jgi:hypothetical protein
LSTHAPCNGDHHQTIRDLLAENQRLRDEVRALRQSRRDMLDEIRAETVAVFLREEILSDTEANSASE